VAGGDEVAREDVEGRISGLLVFSAFLFLQLESLPLRLFLFPVLLQLNLLPRLSL
jgi:hypothetical protein